MRVALDATYSIDSEPSGIAVYSQHLLSGLAATHPDDVFLYCYRLKQFRSSTRTALPNVRRKLLLGSLPTFDADIFHALNQRVDRRAAPRVVSTFHDLFVMTGEYSSPEFRVRFTEQARRAAIRSDLIIAVSEFTAGQVSSLLGVERARIRVVPHGVALLSSSLPSIAREKIVLFVGALQSRKNVLRIVEAFETLPEPWKLVLAGAPTGYRADAILSRIQESKKRERIEITGYLSKPSLDELYARASLFVFPSLDEGFGIPVLEAMTWGIPVVTSNASALKEIAGHAATLVDPLRAEDIAGALRQLIDDPALRERMIAAGRLRAQAFTWERSVKQTYAVYKELTV